MLKFFRRIRRQLISKGRLSRPASPLGRYLLYAIGEILLVVIGILIALQINNWNEQKKEKAKVTVYLSNLLEDLEDDQRNFDISLEVMVFRYYSLQYLYELVEKKPFPTTDDRKDIPVFSGFTPSFIISETWEKPIPQGYDTVFIERSFKWSTRISKRAINRSTLEEMKNTGVFSLLDQEIKDAINHYYGEWEWRLGPANFSLTERSIEKWKDALFQEGINNAAPFERADPVQFLMDDPYRIVLVSQLIQGCAWYISGYQQQLKLAEQLKERILQETHPGPGRSGG